MKHARTILISLAVIAVIGIVGVVVFLRARPSVRPSSATGRCASLVLGVRLAFRNLMASFDDARGEQGAALSLACARDMPWYGFVQELSPDNAAWRTEFTPVLNTERLSFYEFKHWSIRGKQVLDPWGQPYYVDIYTADDAPDSLGLYVCSSGPDGKRGTPDDILALVAAGPASECAPGARPLEPPPSCPIPRHSWWDGLRGPEWFLLLAGGLAVSALALATVLLIRRKRRVREAR